VVFAILEACFIKDTIVQVVFSISNLGLLKSGFSRDFQEKYEQRKQEATWRAIRISFRQDFPETVRGKYGSRATYHGNTLFCRVH